MYFALLLSAISCSNSRIGGNLTLWQSMKWPQYTEETLIDENGRRNVTRKETTLESGNHLIEKYANQKTGIRVCETLLTNFEDHLERDCFSSEGRFRTINTLDQKGRILKTETIDGYRKETRTGEYEYPGQNEVFRAYSKGNLYATVLGEKFGDRTRYTYWVNDANAPSIHIRDYKESGEGHELFVAAGVHETSRTKVFTTDLQKITLTHEISRDYPEGVILGTVKSLMLTGYNIIEEDFRIAAKDFDFDAASDFDTAVRIAEKGTKYRSLKNVEQKPST